MKQLPNEIGKIGIYGLGVVGGALAKYIERFSTIEVVKVDPKLYPNQSMDRGVNSVFICVPVPTKEWKQNLSIIESILHEWRGSQTPIFIRSTVLPGTCDKLSKEFNCNVIAMPEFLTERKADKDMGELPIVVGDKGEKVLHKIFGNKRLVVVSNTEAEFAKYAHNCFGAMKVTYFNAIKNICDRLGMDYGDTLTAILSSGHINAAHTLVPGPDGKSGFGGTCFPKDLEAMIGFVQPDMFSKLLLDVHCMNRIYRGLKEVDG